MRVFLVAARAGEQESPNRDLETSGAEIVVVELPIVRSERLPLGQVFRNLIGNALKLRGAELPRCSRSSEAS